MLNWIVHFSLRFRGVIVALACLVIGYGIWVTAHAKLDVFPNFVPPEVTVQTEAPGMSSEQVEQLVTIPLEQTINGLGGMESMRSESIQGLSSITVVFAEGSDIFRSRAMLNEKLQEVQLPLGVKSPQLSALTSATMDLLKVGLTSTNLSPMDLRTFADWTVKPRLLAVPGVARCIVFGGDVRELQIQVIPDRLIAYNLSISDVLAAARASSAVMGAGYIETPNQRVVIQTQGEALTPEILGQVEVAHNQGQSVRLRDVAIVCEGPGLKTGDSLTQGQPSILLSMASQYGANTMEVTHAVEDALKELQPIFDREGVKVYPRLHRPATFIEHSLTNIRHSLYLGGILVAVVLFLFLGHFRTAFISLTAIPLSLLTAIIVLDKLGVTLNTITLGGLAIAIGEVVDDAIIDVENIFRRLRENKTLPKPRSHFRVVLDASLEVRSAVVYATFIVALVFLPVLALTGLQGSFFAPLALSYILAIMASLGVALTLTPALSLIFFAKGVKDGKEPRLQVWLKRFYGGILSVLSRWPKTVMVVVLLICAGTLLALPQFGSEFLPEFREGHFVLQVQTAPGTSLPAMRQLCAEISRELAKNPKIATVECQIGRASMGEDTWPTHRCEFHLELKELSGEQQEGVSEELRKTLEKFPGIQSSVMTFLGDRISESIAGETAPVVINIFGDDLDTIDAKAAEVAAVLQKVPGAKDVELKSPPGEPRMAVRLQPEKMAQFGFRPTDILEALQTAYQGQIVTQVHRGNQVINLAMILDEASRRDPESIGALKLSNAQGLRMPLSELAEVYLTDGRFLITHEGSRRRQVVTCAPEGRDVTSFVEDAQKQIAAKVKFPKGVYPIFAGAAEATAKAQRQLLLNSTIAGVGILLLLVVVTGNWRNLLLILANIPFALVGGVLVVYIVGRLGDPGEAGLNIGSLVGFVTLFGITTRNSIMMISHFEHLVQTEGMAWGHDAAIRGASERLIPILMTAIVTGLGLLPLAIGSGEAGREIEGPMAMVILGGLITSTVLNLLVLPTLALRYGKFLPKSATEDI